MRCTYDPATRGGNAPDGRKVKATIHWVSAEHSIPAEVRLYNSLFTKPDPNGGENFSADLNPNSLETLTGARLEPALADARVERAGTVRAEGLFLPRSRFKAWQAGVQPHDWPSRHLGEGEGRRLKHWRSRSPQGPQMWSAGCCKRLKNF